MSTSTTGAPAWDGPRNFTTTPDDHGGIALTICTLMATWVVLCYGVRVFMRVTVSGPFGKDDILTGVATVLAVIQMSVSCVAISAGFGKSTKLLTPDQIVRAEKAVYSAQLLYIVTNAMTKCCVALLLARIVFISARVKACYGVLIASILWGVASFIAEAVRCTEYPPWQTYGGSCPNQILAWKVIIAFDVTIEAALFALPIWLIWDLQTTRKKKAVVVLMFGLRLPIIIASISRVHYLEKAIGSTQPLLDGVIPFICLNIEMHYGVIAATIPTLKPFFGAFNTGWGSYDSHGYSTYGHGTRSNSYQLKSLERRMFGTDRSSKPESQTERMDMDAISGLMGSAPLHRKKSDGSGSSKQMIIHQTRTCEVRYEDDDTQRSPIDGDLIAFAPSRPP